MELCKHVETTFVPSGAILFRPGQLDDSIYVVKNGRLKVYIMESVRGKIKCTITKFCALCVYKSMYVYFYNPLPPRMAVSSP